MPIQVDPDSTGKLVDTATVAGNERVIEVIGDAVDAAALTKVMNSAPSTEYGLVTRNIPSGTQPVSGPLTDAQLRALAVPVSGTFFQATQPVSAAALPLPAGASTEATLALIKAKTDNLDVALSTRTKPADTQPVSGTFFQATQPVSAASLPLPTGAATEATLSAMSAKLPATLGQKAMAASLSVVIASDQDKPIFRGRSSTFRTPGRAGTTGQKILSIHNATGSAVTVTVLKVIVDLMQTVVKAITVAPPVIRLWKVTVLPTNGTALAENKVGGSGASNVAVTVLGDASADGTGSGTTLTATLPAGTIITQEFAPRLLTGGANYEPADRIEFLGNGEEVELGPLEGLVVFLDYVLATQNPTTDMWIAGVEWREK